MIVLCAQSSTVVGSCGRSRLFDLGKSCTLRGRTGRSLVDSSALRQDRLVTPIGQPPLEVLRRLCFRWFQKLSLPTDLTLTPPWRMSSRVCKMLCLRARRKMHMGYLFGHSNLTPESHKFLNVGKELLLLKRTRLLVRGTFRNAEICFVFMHFLHVCLSVSFKPSTLMLCLIWCLHWWYAFLEACLLQMKWGLFILTHSWLTFKNIFFFIKSSVHPLDLCSMTWENQTWWSPATESSSLTHMP